jgi:hypothetical protein
MATICKDILSEVPRAIGAIMEDGIRAVKGTLDRLADGESGAASSHAIDRDRPSPRPHASVTRIAPARGISAPARRSSRREPETETERRHTMSTKLAILAAALVAVLTGPALAHGRPAHVRVMQSVPANAYGAVRADDPAPVSDPYRDDFQLQGRY